MLTSEFYRMLHPFPTNSYLMYNQIPYRHSSHQYGPFLDGLKTTSNPIRLIALCHGLICGVKNFNMKVVRVNNTVQGVCSLIGNDDKYRFAYHLTLPTRDNNEFIHKAKILATENMHKIFSVKLTSLTDETRGSHDKINDMDCEHYNTAYDQCQHIKEAPFKEFIPHQKQFDKIFQGDPGLCFLFIGYIPEDSDVYEYINLFALQPKFTLEDIITNYTPNCKELYFADFSCCNPCDRFYPTEIHKATYGGRKTKKYKSKI